MATIITPLRMYADSGPMYRYGSAIEGQQKQFTFYWNSREAMWHFDIRNEDQTEVVLGVPIVAEYPLLVDHPMEEFGLSGYFVLLPSIAGTPPPIDSAMTAVPENYKLFYVYLTE